MMERWLCEIPGLGRKRIHRLREGYLEKYQTAEGFAAFLHAERPENLLFFCGELFRGGEAGEVCARILGGREAAGRRAESGPSGTGAICFVDYDAPEFPERLKEIPDPPYGLYYVGRLPDPAGPSVSVIGSRGPSDYGRRQARAFAEALAGSGVQIISGMARGVDGIAQRSAVEAGGVSFAVMGCGADVIYPRENAALYGMLAGGSGGVISEYPPGTEPKMGLFPDRNRLIAGLCDVLLVIEAKERSGTLITVDRALEQGRTVFALPGRVEDALSLGCNRLIRQGAEIASEPEDLLLSLGMTGAGREGEADALSGGKGSGGGMQAAGCGHWRTKEEMKLISLQEPEASVYRILTANDLSDTEEIRYRLEKELHRRVSRGEMARILMQMEAKGLAEEKSLGVYARK